jgi:membrane-bound serine protease (ClpP class)
MVPSETLIVPNVVYLLLMAGVWLAAMAIVSPGTGLLEVGAVTILVMAGLGALRLPVDLWALGVIGVGVVLFLGALRWRRTALWLVLSALLLSVGSAFLLGMQAGQPAVHPLLAAVISALTVGFFWLSVRRGVLAQRARPLHNPDDLLGQVGDVRSALEPVGSVYVGGELWSARSEHPLTVGTTVRVRGREGLVLLVDPVPGGPAAIP